MTCVPTISLDREPTSFGAELDAICHAMGFFQVVGHGISDDIADAAWASATAFFDLPLKERLAVASLEPGYPYGYSPLAAETLSRSSGEVTPPDLKEVFNVGPVDLPVHQFADPGEAWAYSPNLWPDMALPELRSTWEPYYRAMLALSDRLMSLFARVLGLPPGLFADKIDRSPSALRAINYPDLQQEPALGQLRASAHTDYGTLTILRQDNAPGGLEVLDNRRGVWVPVDYIPGAFVINIGDLMARWTNDRWRSALHRVVNPPSGLRTTTRRQSIAFFHNANYDCRVECLSSCLTSGESPRYSPVLAGPYLMDRFQKTVIG